MTTHLNPGEDRRADRRLGPSLYPPPETGATNCKKVRVSPVVPIPSRKGFAGTYRTQGRQHSEPFILSHEPWTTGEGRRARAKVAGVGFAKRSLAGRTTGWIPSTTLVVGLQSNRFLETPGPDSPPCRSGLRRGRRGLVSRCACRVRPVCAAAFRAESCDGFPLSRACPGYPASRAGFVVGRCGVAASCLRLVGVPVVAAPGTSGSPASVRLPGVPACATTIWGEDHGNPCR